MSGWSKVKKLTEDSHATISDFEDADLTEEYVRYLLSDPSSQTYCALNQWLKLCSSEWIGDFLNCHGLKFMFAGLTFMNLKSSHKFTDTVTQLEIVRCIKSVINSVVGIEFLVNSNDDLMSVMVLCK